MKKIGMVLVLCLCGSSAFANSNASLQIQTVKSLYNQCKSYLAYNEKNIGNPFHEDKDCREILYKLASNDFRKAIEIAIYFNKHRDVDYNDGFPCDELNNIMWNAQDPGYKEKLVFTNLPNNRVKVKFSHGGHATYSLSCHKNKCRITDLFDGYNTSQKKAMFKECRYR